MQGAGRAVAIASVTAVVLLLLVAGAQAPRPGAQLASVARTWPVVVLGLVLLAALVALLSVARTQLGFRPPEQEGGPGRLVRAALLLGLVLAVVVLVPPADAPPVESTPFGVADDAPPPVGDTPPVFEDVTVAPSSLAVVVLSVVLLGAAVGLVSAAGRRREDVAEHLLDDVVRRVEADLRTDDDPRTAVLRAFATLEDSFADTGAARAAAETQSAWVERLLVEHGAAAGPARSLCARFELARFAGRPVGEDARVGALQDLEALLSTRSTS